MDMLTSSGAGFTRMLASEEATRRLAIDVANMLEPGDFVALAGDLGAGKTTFARAMISHLAGRAEIEVPSPTFTLVQSYDLPRFTLVHADLYRIGGAGDLAELGLDDIEGAVVVMEWPERAASALPADRIDITLALTGKDESEERRAFLVGHGAAAARVDRLGALMGFLDEAGYGSDERVRIAGDASTRSYERIIHGGKSFIVMNAPPKPDGPPLKRGLSYSAIAHLAEDVKPFVAVARVLRARGLSAPKIFAADYEAGFIVLEDLGVEPMVADGKPVPERYERATDLLADLHREAPAEVLPVAPHVDYRMPSYDLDAFLIEAELLIDWYLPYRGTVPSAEVRALFLSLWRDALRPALDSPQSLVLRDYHSPNLLWLADREGFAQVGLLDFQDAVRGPAAYDVASLLQDARVDVDEALESALFGRYARARREADARFDADAFARIYATLAVQRATKILGIFARLDRRDGKPQYLRHMPRVYGYLRRALTHPALAGLDTWYRRNVPPP
jgi:tRNA threonylcarbamoyl adenosine modification protein YjeE